jgi:hypothetical protein
MAWILDQFPERESIPHEIGLVGMLSGISKKKKRLVAGLLDPIMGLQ